MAKCQKCGQNVGIGLIRCPVCGHVNAEDPPEEPKVSNHYAFGGFSAFCLGVSQIVVVIGLVCSVIAWFIAPFKGEWLAFFVLIPLSFILALGSFYMLARVRAMKGLLQAMEDQLEKQERINCSRFVALLQNQKKDEQE